MPFDSETIAAIATASGRGGIGIVRLSGPLAATIAASLLHLKHPLQHARTRFGQLLDEHGRPLDEALVTLFTAPRSYTGEDVAEIAIHGAPVLLEHLLRASIHAGARLAEPGEFTRRAFLNQRLDLTQAEAVADLVNATTLGQARLAAAQLGGALSHTIAPIKQQLIALIAALEAGVDFAEDDLDLLPESEIAARLQALAAALLPLEASFRRGRVLREGARLAIVGRPNAGKSSLFNRLLETERAIVSPVPGTTRDPIAERLAIDGIPIELIDTAGLRTTPSGPHAAIEAEGIRRTHTALAEADLVLHVIDPTDPTPPDTAVENLLQARPSIIIYSKCDLISSKPSGLAVSAVTGEGIEDLRQAIVQAVTGNAAPSETAMLTNLRQHQSITAALAATRRAMQAAASRTPHEFLLLDLYATLTALDVLTGVTAPDDILNLIFSTFCIGK